jgi:hypothetical protein
MSKSLFDSKELMEYYRMTAKICIEKPEIFEESKTVAGRLLDIIQSECTTLAAGVMSCFLASRTLMAAKKLSKKL